jgi:ribosomal protein S18 acetylase RimI-like enzyme
MPAPSTEQRPNAAELVRMLLEHGDTNSLDGLNPPVVHAYVDKILRTATILSVRAGDTLQAFLAFYCNDHHGRAGYMSMLAVHGDFRRKGLAALLVLESVRRLRQLAFNTYLLEVYKANAPAIRLYEGLGFEQSGRETGRTIFMELRLAANPPGAAAFSMEA